MSYEHVDAVFPIILPATEKAVLLALCRHAHKDGSCAFPSIKLLAWESGNHPRTVQRALRALEDRNYIVAEGSKAGGRHGQTVSYRVLVPNADVIAAVKALWKHGITGGGVAPDEPVTGGGVAPEAEETGLTGGGVAPTGGGVAPTGGGVAPKSVREPVSEPVTTTPTPTSGEGAVVDVPKDAGTRMVQYLAKELGYTTLPATAQQKAELNKLAVGVPGDVMGVAIRAWVSERELKGMKFPVGFLLKELPAYISAAVLSANAPPPGEFIATPEQEAMWALQAAQQDGFATVEEWTEHNRKIAQDVAYDMKGDEIMRELHLEEQGEDYGFKKV
jgi:Helix-turn-helix domain